MLPEPDEPLPVDEEVDEHGGANVLDVSDE